MIPDLDSPATALAVGEPFQATELAELIGCRPERLRVHLPLRAPWAASPPFPRRPVLQWLARGAPPGFILSSLPEPDADLLDHVTLRDLLDPSRRHAALHRSVAVYLDVVMAGRDRIAARLEERRRVGLDPEAAVHYQAHLDALDADCALAAVVEAVLDPEPGARERRLWELARQLPADLQDLAIALLPEDAVA